MSAIEDAVEQIVPTDEGSPLLRGLLIGVALGATVAAVVILTRSLRARRAARRGPGDQSPPTLPPLGAAPSPL